MARLDSEEGLDTGMRYPEWFSRSNGGPRGNSCPEALDARPISQQSLLKSTELSGPPVNLKTKHMSVKNLKTSESHISVNLKTNIKHMSKPYVDYNTGWLTFPDLKTGWYDFASRKQGTSVASQSPSRKQDTGDQSPRRKLAERTVELPEELGTRTP